MRSLSSVELEIIEIQMSNIKCHSLNIGSHNSNKLKTVSYIDGHTSSWSNQPFGFVKV